MNRRLAANAFMAFALSRLLLFALLIAGSQLAFHGKVYSNTIWETSIRLEAARFSPELQRIVMTGDAWWYRSIATGGYDVMPRADRTTNRAFFPLFPLIVRGAAITGSFALDGMLVSNTALLAALLLLGPLAVACGFTTEAAQRAVFYLAFAPAAYFCSLPLTEGVFLLLSVASFLAARRDRWWLAGLLGGLAALTRVTGLLLFPALLVEAAVRRRWRDMPWLLLIPAGMGIFMVHLHRVTGDALAFVHAQEGWGRRASWFWTPLVEYFNDPLYFAQPWNLRVLNAGCAIAILIASGILFRQKRWSLGTYALLAVLVPLASGSLQSMARYATVTFPLFLVLGAATARPLADRAVSGVLVTLYGALIVLFVLRVDLALA